MTTTNSLHNKTIWVTGAQGMVGHALIKKLSHIDCTLLTTTKSDLDLRIQADVDQFLKEQKPDMVFLAAAKVGGIKANRDESADFLYDNLMIESNVIHAAYKNRVEKLLFLGSSCIYPRSAAQPVTEDALLSAPLESTNEAYAIAKIAGIKLCEHYRKQYDCNFISAMPCNLYGPNDYYDLQRSHVIPALIMKLHDAKQQRRPHLELWGTGTPLREFMHVDDLADALLFMMEHYNDAAPLNIGSGHEVSISDLARTLANIIGYEGMITFNPDMPDGVPRKLLDSSRMHAMGWQAQTDLATGLKHTYQDFCENAKQRLAA